jgi:uncharacterized SAM-binding protein YcdF (DUF218 family)
MIGVLTLVFTSAGTSLGEWLNVSTNDPPQADYIVCLGGGWGREVRAAQLWHRHIAPRIIVSNRPGAAEGMRTLLVQAGVPADCVVVDRTSETTADHPGGVARLPGVDRARTRLVLVTDRTHSRRARACFLKAGFQNVTVYSGVEISRAPRSYWEWCEWRIAHWPVVVYEVGAMAKYICQGKM